MIPRAINLKAYAKINLFLEVLGRRNDGYNEIRTIFSEIELYDELSFILTKKERVRILTDTDSLRNEENLVYKVAVFIREKYNVNAGVEIELKKKIPIAGGLGGGSSDAAQTILALNKLWELSLSKAELNEIAACWGSDINFFLQGATALGSARGEKITTLPGIRLDNIFLVNPGFGISSKEAYELVEYDSERKDWQEFWEKKDCRNSFNRLEAGIRRKYPEIAEMIEHLQSGGAEQAILSGSGATIIGFCPDRTTAERFTHYYSGKGFWNTITKTKGEPNEHY
ncbi:MAG: 4-(cytidine 5'-diphospho)-2-C-methyl-D-erythritol kinase [Candidatus Cloacimonetes bacterium]|nr:4-(cytidine 5'-diphospho)-2-C-methyl-D-erythritol kinase [Candidatus Cloacimonadota bacterium]